MNLKAIFTTTTIDVSESPFIPERFQREVSLHIFKNYHANKEHSFKTPLILAISGAPGMGKSFQAEAVLNNLNYSCTSVTAFENSCV